MPVADVQPDLTVGGFDPFASDGPWVYDADKADRVVNFITKWCRHTKGAKARQLLELEDWQERMVRAIFGVVHEDTGKRRFRRGLLFVPRKNGKTTLCSAIALYLLTCDDEQGAEVYSAAADRDQARICFEIASRMVALDPDGLGTVAKTFRHSIVDESTASTYKALSSEVGTKHGLNAHGILFDELHVQKDDELFHVLETSMGARQQPLLLMVTTAGFDRHSLCKRMYDYAKDVRDGAIDDPTFLPVIFEAPEHCGVLDEEAWAVANPNLGVSINVDYLRQQAQMASRSAVEENKFRRLHLNQWTEQDIRWLRMEDWDACAEDVPDSTLTGMECFGGLDLSTTTDLSSLVLLFPLPGETRRYAIRGWHWIPGENVEARSKRDHVPYVEWVASGKIRTTEGSSIDYDKIRAQVNEIGKRYKIREIGIDRYNATQLAQQLDGDGFTVVPVAQGYLSLSPPTKELEALVLGRGILHGGCPVLRWMAQNVAVEIDSAGNVRPSKKRSTERIDGIVALIIGLGRAMLRTGSVESVYKTRGLRLL